MIWLSSGYMGLLLDAPVQREAQCFAAAALQCCSQHKCCRAVRWVLLCTVSARS